MYDWNHVNGEGAERISRIYADILQRQMNGEDISEYVYDSVEQMQENILFVYSLKGSGSHTECLRFLHTH